MADDWDYSGGPHPYKKLLAPPEWKKAYPDARGKKQSPINIITANSPNGAAGHLVRLAYEGRLELSEEKHFEHHIQIDVAQENNGKYVAGGIIFNDAVKDIPVALKQFHIHTPSEHRINGVEYPAELNFVHSGGPGARGIILSVLVEYGEVDNPVLLMLAGHLSLRRKMKEVIDPLEGFPPPKKRGYYRYEGSLTTPPCTEGIVWYVFKTPIVATPSLLDEFRRTTRAPASRPLQPLNARKVKYFRDIGIAGIVPKKS